MIYPLLAYKNFTPDNKEICIVHLALNDMPQKVINLGEWEFVSFVNHTLMCEQKLFGKTHEKNCDIMLLVERKGKTRLISYKSDPWFKHLKQDPEQDSKQDYLYISTGFLKIN